MSSLITTPLELLLPYQARWVADESRFKAGIWSRQSGKDFSTAAEAVRDAMLRAKTTWMIAAPSERQAMESLAKCKEWAEAFSLALAAEEIERQDGPNTLLKSGSITFANGSRILAVPGRPDTVRGFSANLVLTEFAFFEDPDATWRAVLPSITNPLRGGEKKVRLITTPNGKTGRGARTYKIISDNLLQPVEGRKQHWSCHVVTIAKAVEDGLPIDIDELRESLDDPIGWAQEYMCEFLDSSNVLLPYDLIATAESASATVSCDPAIYLGGKLDLRLGDGELEIFNAHEPPARLSYPEAAGLRHLAFRVDSVAEAVVELAAKGIACEPVRMDEYSRKPFTFFRDPDGLPLELHE